MSFAPFGLSRDLAALAADGFELELTQGGHLLVKEVPYRTNDGQLARGTVVTKLEMNGDLTVNPVQDHTVRFVGQAPCNGLGQVLRAVINSDEIEIEPGLVTNHQLSAKPDAAFPDYHAKVTAYVRLIEAEAQAVDPDVTARTDGPCVVCNESWPFEYVDTASGRAGIGAISGRLGGQKVAIVGIGGTGSYILDLVAKCPVSEIHLFDGDRFSTHNAFRAPGAATIEQLRSSPLKVDYFKSAYSPMKRNIVAHPYNIDSSNAVELREMSFVFLAMEGGVVKRGIVTALEEMNLPFVDSSLGVVKSGGSGVLLASVEITGSTPSNRASVHTNVDFGDVDDDDPYTENIQIAELNALNATLAVLWWKKQAGLYHERTSHHHLHLNIGFDRLSSE